MIDDLEGVFAGAARRECRRVAEAVVDEIRVMISVLYPPASIPGAPPAWRTGTLSRGYRVQDTPTGAEVVNRVEYAVYLELGTRRMAPRPHIRPAVEAVRAVNT